jgi:hypothetical protein
VIQTLSAFSSRFAGVASANETLVAHGDHECWSPMGFTL